MRESNGPRWGSSMSEVERKPQNIGASKTRRTLGSIGRALGAPINAFRTAMPSDVAMSLTPPAQCRWADDEATKLGSRLRRACGEATLWCAEFERMNDRGATPAARILAKNGAAAREEWETYRAWLIAAHARLSTGAPSEPVNADWTMWRSRLSIIKPRNV